MIFVSHLKNHQKAIVIFSHPFHLFLSKDEINFSKK